jgi:hypothetical protein
MGLRPISLLKGTRVADLLILNASNYPVRPIFPYAFAQLRALAKGAGVATVTCDLLFIPRNEWQSQITALIRAHAPRMVGLHLRQADSLVHSEYACANGPRYFPVEDTVLALQLVRAATSAPTVIGGFGFTTHAQRIFDRFPIDYGIVGEPDAFFRYFDDVVAGRDLQRVDNLIFREGATVRSTSRSYGLPFGDREYDDEIIAQMRAFYAAAPPAPGGQESVAVEVARGCPYRCDFCTEPHVKGGRVRTRPLEAVCGDAEFLLNRGYRRFWMVCSELNPGHADHARLLAESLIRLRERTGTPFVWHAYHLPRWLERSDFELLAHSGFVGGWNDFPSFDDDNLKKTRVPYRTRHAVSHVRISLETLPKTPYTGPPRFSIFLGNAHATPQTVARTLLAYHAAGLHQEFEFVDIATATRLFEVPGHITEGAVEAETFLSTGPSTAPDFVHPTFHCAPALQSAAGGRAELLDLLDYARSTLFGHAPSPNWADFLGTAATTECVAGWLGYWRAREWSVRGFDPELVTLGTRALARIVACETGAVLTEFFQEPTRDELARQVARAVVGLLLRVPAPRYQDLLEHLGVARSENPAALSSYVLLHRLLERFEDEQSLVDSARHALGLPANSLEVFRLRALLFAKNVRFKPGLKQFVVVEPAAREHAGAAE